MTLFKYLSNGVTKKGYNINNCYDFLVEEFKKGNITYPRSDGFFHDEINIINFNEINPEVKELLLMANNWPIENKQEESLIGDFFTLSSRLYLATPGSIVNDYNKIEREKIKPDKEKVDLFLGLKMKKEYENNDYYIKRKNFKFSNFLKRIKDHKVIKEVKIDPKLKDIIVA